MLSNVHVIFSSSLQAANDALPSNLTASDDMNRQLPQPLDSPTLMDETNSNSSTTAGVVAGIVAGIIGAVLLLAVGSILIVRRRKRQRQQQRLQHLFSPKPTEQVPHLATAALVRASSSGSTDSSGSHPGTHETLPLHFHRHGYSQHGPPAYCICVETLDRRYNKQQPWTVLL